MSPNKFNEHTQARTYAHMHACTKTTINKMFHLYYRSDLFTGGRETQLVLKRQNENFSGAAGKFYYFFMHEKTA